MLENFFFIYTGQLHVYKPHSVSLRVHTDVLLSMKLSKLAHDCKENSLTCVLIRDFFFFRLEALLDPNKNTSFSRFTDSVDYAAHWNTAVHTDRVRFAAVATSVALSFEISLQFHTMSWSTILRNLDISKRSIRVFCLFIVWFIASIPLFVEGNPGTISLSLTTLSELVNATLYIH